MLSVLNMVISKSDTCEFSMYARVRFTPWSFVANKLWDGVRSKVCVCVRACVRACVRVCVCVCVCEKLSFLFFRLGAIVEFKGKFVAQGMAS